jgi:hypothetical protein
MGVIKHVSAKKHYSMSIKPQEIETATDARRLKTIKVKVALGQSIKAHSGSKGIALLFL